jgi:hypothetical protein
LIDFQALARLLRRGRGFFDIVGGRLNGGGGVIDGAFDCFASFAHGLAGGVDNIADNIASGLNRCVSSFAGGRSGLFSFGFSGFDSRISLGAASGKHNGGNGRDQDLVHDENPFCVTV